LNRLFFGYLLAACGLASLGSPAPSRPIVMIKAAGGGGTNDIVGRQSSEVRGHG
jgi:tripartite-type tricarboxylate transporter receptor subunit TctC